MVAFGGFPGGPLAGSLLSLSATSLRLRLCIALACISLFIFVLFDCLAQLAFTFIFLLFLQPNDILVKWNDTLMKTRHGLEEQLQRLKPGTCTCDLHPRQSGPLSEYFVRVTSGELGL